MTFFQTAETHDAALAQTLPERTATRAVYDTLGEAEGLARAWNSESGGKRWVFDLRPGVRLHNGATFTATTARLSLERALTQGHSQVVARLRRAQLLCSSPLPSRLTCDLAEPLPLPEILADPAMSISDADGAGTGPFRVASWTRGARARLEAFDAHWRGRPFLDAVEMEFGADARRQRVEFELKRADVVVTPPTEPRPPAAPRALQPTNLLLLGIDASGAFASIVARRVLAAAIDRETLTRLLPPGSAEAAESFLPQWLSGYTFLLNAFTAAATTGAGVPRGPFSVVYDESDPVARLIASRLSLELRPTGMELRATGVPPSAFPQARTGPHTFVLETVRLNAENPAAALFDALSRYGSDGEPFFNAPIETQFRAERDALETWRAIPLLHYRDQYVFQPGLEHLRIFGGVLDLSNAWKK